MRVLLTLLWAFAALTSATLTFTLQRAGNPTSDQNDAYQRIQSAMSAAVARYNRLAPRANKALTAQYVPSVATADGNFNGNIRFGSNRAYMNERTALHEISHTLGIGQTRAFDERCAANNWPGATRLLQSWDGQGAKINCGGGHIWPYGLNYDNEWSETNAERHCLLIDAMLADGLAG
ncbi:hypothetical protein CHGG_06939 [Chaetomium globosum CBS 148.51]|uniref:Ricin B lectin n=1 Tax=Chaetomium globosum (strain ATCC 6205 / CBS 148.51 / DSM 1962 / NBRC 6347 / NRRL 1970) TaxID=306901 RepID=Q2GYL5_CHAGB|nr:uncharacterized protein CHGG_06939 [Chaetomium globosum CBS 148.51]EAQ85686.1 hypothetical protein CHGG_06939 [Chaetomium globosum CBS 148.51]